MNSPIPYSSIKEFEPGFLTEWSRRVDEISKNTIFVGGEWNSKLEARLAREAKTTHAINCANGTDALQLVLRALDIGPGKKVAIPDFTFWATFEAVCNVGASPITVDVDPLSFHMSESTIREAIKKFRPEAIILVHLFGWACPETEQIRNLCQEEEILLIEDSAQAWDVRLNGQPLLSKSFVSTVSFYPGKVLGAAGDGGAVLTNDKRLAERVRLLANHGRRGKYEHVEVGWNSRMDNLQAAYVDLSLDYLPQRLASRRHATQWYRENCNSKKINFLKPANGVIENGYISVGYAEASARKALESVFQSDDIGYGIVYPETISRQAGAKKFIAGTVETGVAAAATQRVFNPPCFAGITKAQLERVGEALTRGFK